MKKWKVELIRDDDDLENRLNELESSGHAIFSITQTNYTYTLISYHKE